MSSTISKPDFPYAIESLPEEENAQIKRDFQGYLSGGVQVGPKGYFFQGIYRDYASSYYNFQLHPTDVFVASYPKSGGWVQSRSTVSDPPLSGILYTHTHTYYSKHHADIAYPRCVDILWLMI